MKIIQIKPTLWSTCSHPTDTCNQWQWLKSFKGSQAIKFGSHWTRLHWLDEASYFLHRRALWFDPLPCCQYTFDFLWEQLTQTDGPAGRLPVPFCSSMVHQQHRAVFSLQPLSAAAVSSCAAGVPHPEMDLQEGQVSPTHQSSSGRPGWSRRLQHTAAWGSLCPARDVCCTAERRRQ